MFFHIFSQIFSASCHASYNSSFLVFKINFCMHILHNSCFLVDSMQVRTNIFWIFDLILFYTSRVFNFGFFHTFHISYVFFHNICYISSHTFILFHNISQHLLCLFLSLYFVSQYFLAFG